MKRRSPLRTHVAAGAVAGTRKPRTWLEVENDLAELCAKGKLMRNELPTPALLLDLDAFEYNVHKMAEHMRLQGRALRPHGKAHKCPEIAKILIRAGAVGCCAAKISEAEVFAVGGVRGLLITTAVIGKRKIERAVRLARSHPDTIFSVDDASNVRDLNDAAGQTGVRFNLAIDLCIGGRTGIQPGKAAVGLAELIESLSHVSLAGLQAYAGHAAHVVGWEERRNVSLAAMGQAVATRELLEKAGIGAPLLSGGSTGTYNIDSEMPGVTELQPGSFIFMDVSYNIIGGRTGPVLDDFHNSLSVLTTVVSRPGHDLAVIDAGFKAFATDQPCVPLPKNKEQLSYTWGGDEHGLLHYARGAQAAKIGDTVEFLVPHCDPTVNLYDRLFCLRKDRVEAVWPIAARGMSQ